MPLQLFKALADETRLRIAHILFHYELSVNELARILDMGQSRISRHLKILTEALLLRFRRDGLWVFYSVPQEGRQFEFLSAVLPFAERRFSQDLDRAVEILEERAHKTRQFFNSIAEDWDALNHEILGDFDLTAEVLAAMPKDCGTAADLGCGTGEVLERMLGSTRLGIGVDGSARMLDLCRSRIQAAPENCSLRIGELSHLPLADREANFVCVNLVLHHLPRPEAIFPEIARILAPQGVVFIADFLRHNDENLRRRYGDQWLGFDSEEIGFLLGRHGFRLLSSRTRPVNKNLSLFLITAQL